MLMNKNSGLQIKNISKSFGNKEVVRCVDLNINKGEIVGLLGPNGAGKTTVFYIIVGLLKSDSGEDYYGLFHESFSPLPLHVDSGFDAKTIIYKQVITPLTPIGDTIFFKKRWYGKSATFTIDEEELKFKPKPGQNERSRGHLGEKEFDKELHKKYLSHIDINNLKGLEIEMLYSWKVGETLIVDRTHVHCASSRINNKKLASSQRCYCYRIINNYGVEERSCFKR